MVLIFAVLCYALQVGRVADGLEGVSLLTLISGMFPFYIVFLSSLSFFFKTILLYYHNSVLHLFDNTCCPHHL